MIKYVGYIVIFWTCVQLSFSQTVSDSVSKKFPEITVEGKSELSNQGFNYISNQLLDSKTIAKINPIQVSDALQYIAGVNIRDYGGLSSIQTVSLRGLPSNQTLILLDGLRINNSQTGLADISNLFISNIDRMEVAKGSNSSQFGSNAIAGVVNIISKTELMDNYKFVASYDNFTNKMFEVDLTQNIDSIPFALKVRKIISDGTYTFNLDGKDYKRANSQVDNLDAMLGTVLDIFGFTVKPKVMFRSSKRGSPEPVIGGLQRPSSAYLKEANAIAMFTANKNLDDNKELKLGAIYNYSDLQYKNSQAIEFGKDGLDNDFYNSSLQLRADYTSEYKNLSYGFSADAFANKLNGDMLQEVDGNIARNNIGLSGNMDYTKKSVVIEYSFYSSFRADYSTDFSANYSPMIGVSANVVQAHLITKAAMTTGYRLPSFNEMYYLNYGNQDLKPEKSITYNIGMDYSPPNFGLLGVNLFYTKTKDQISAIPTGPITWQSQNIDKVNTKGVEFVVSLSPINNLDIKYNYIYQQALIERGYGEDKLLLPYTPEEIISGLVSYKLEDYLLGASFQYKSYVFTTIDNDLGLLLDSYALFDVFASYSPELYGGKLLLRLDIRNILDKQYQIFINYPMPGRNIRGTISYEI